MDMLPVDRAHAEHFRAAAAPAASAADERPSTADVLDLARRHGVELLGPIPVLA
jgi:hypothetical protein